VFGANPISGSGTSPLTLTTAATTAPGSYSVTVTGTYPLGTSMPCPVLRHTTVLTLVVGAN
jgi:hypothetical protein